MVLKSEAKIPSGNEWSKGYKKECDRAVGVAQSVLSLPEGLGFSKDAHIHRKKKKI